MLFSKRGLSARFPERVRVMYEAGPWYGLSITGAAHEMTDTQVCVEQNTPQTKNVTCSLNQPKLAAVTPQLVTYSLPSVLATCEVQRHPS